MASTLTAPMLDSVGVARAPARVAGYLDEPAEIDAVVAQLCAIERAVGLERSIAIGQLILHRFFGGSADLWRARSKKKNNSVRRIALHPACPLSRSSLSEAIGVYVVARELPFVRTSGHIGASHVVAVLGLGREAQRTWLERTALHRWSVRELRERIRLEPGARRGGPARAPLDPSVIALRRSVRALDRAVRAATAVGHLSSQDLVQVRELSGEVRCLEARLEGWMGAVDPGDPPRIDRVATPGDESAQVARRVSHACRGRSERGRGDASAG